MQKFEALLVREKDSRVDWERSDRDHPVTPHEHRPPFRPVRLPEAVQHPRVAWLKRIVGLDPRLHYVQRHYHRPRNQSCKLVSYRKRLCCCSLVSACNRGNFGQIMLDQKFSPPTSASAHFFPVKQVVHDGQAPLVDEKHCDVHRESPQRHHRRPVPEYLASALCVALPYAVHHPLVVGVEGIVGLHPRLDKVERQNEHPRENTWKAPSNVLVSFCEGACLIPSFVCVQWSCFCYRMAVLA